MAALGRIFVAIIAVTCCAGCGESSSNTRLVGVWQGRQAFSEDELHSPANKTKAEHVIMTMELKHSGKGTLSGPLTQSDNNVTVVWKLSDDDASSGVLKIGITGDYQMLKVQFDGEDRFTLKWRKTTPLVFTRMKSETASK